MTVRNTLAAGLLLALLAAPAAAHDAKDPRHIAMTGLGKDMKAINEAVQGGTAATADIVAAAERIAATASRMLDLFPAGSGGAHSRAKPEIWQDWDGFRAASDKFAAAADGLVQAARAGDQALGAALTATGRTCKGCHQNYRKPKKQ